MCPDIATLWLFVKFRHKEISTSTPFSRLVQSSGMPTPPPPFSLPRVSCMSANHWYVQGCSWKTATLLPIDPDYIWYFKQFLTLLFHRLLTVHLSSSHYPLFLFIFLLFPKRLKRLLIKELKGLARPVLKYSSSVWDPCIHIQTHKYTVFKMQKRTANFVTGNCSRVWVAFYNVNLSTLQPVYKRNELLLFIAFSCYI